jgi:Uma2 family endonuclease
MALVHPDQHYTYSDYISWDDDVRYELIDGVPYMLSAPLREHQRTCVQLTRQLGNFLEGKPCEVIAAPFDVRLNADEGDDTVVQPDLIVVCDMTKLKDNKACIGAPDLVIEVLSPSSARRDRVKKFNLYQKTGVREYWIVDVDTKTVQVCILKNDEYITKAYEDTDTVPVHVLEGCTISLPDVFAES